MKKAIVAVCSAVLVFSSITALEGTKIKAAEEDGDIIIITPSETDEYHEAGDLDFEDWNTGGNKETNTNEETTKKIQQTTTNKNTNQKVEESVATSNRNGNTVQVKKPGKVKIVSATKSNAKSVRAKIRLKKIKGVSGYQVKYSYNKKLKKSLTKTKNYKKNKIILKKLKAEKKYYIKARAYVKSGNKKVYGSWSKKKIVRVKK